MCFILCHLSYFGVSIYTSAPIETTTERKITRNAWGVLDTPVICLYSIHLLYTESQSTHNHRTVKKPTWSLKKF